MKKNFNEHINRIKYLTIYNGKKLIKEDVSIDQTLNDPNFEKNIENALNQVMRDLPNELNQTAKNTGNRDGQLDVNDTSNNIALQNQQPQQVTESDLKEAVGMLTLGGALALPAMTNLIGKAASFLGKKLDSNNLNKFGEKAKYYGDKMHHSYENIIDKILLPLTKNVTPEKRHLINKLVFYSIVATFFGFGAGGALHAAGAGKAGLAAAEGSLSSVKASELVAAVRQILPKILSSVGVS